MICPSCGAGADPGARFCEACGVSLAATAGGNGASISATAERREIDLAPGLAAVSDRGLIHPHNEDAVALSRSTAAGGTQVSLLVVCDGVSSSHDAALGAQTAAAAAVESLLVGVATGKETENAMRTAILAAHDAVCRLVPAGADVADRPLTTIVAALARPGAVTIGWAGDSRAYFVGGVGRQLTRDDSWVNWVVERGEMNEAEAIHSPNAHAIVQCLGDPDEPPEPHIVTTVPKPGEKLLLCTDGLWNYVPESSDLDALLSRFAKGTPAVALCSALVAFANHAGGHDNITAAICDCL
jgi:PPM family protein phosphatase